MSYDQDFFKDSLSTDQLVDQIKKAKETGYQFKRNVGFHFQSDKTTTALALIDAIGLKKFPVQINASNLMQFTMDFYYSDFLFEAYADGKLDLLMHAPFWLNFWNTKKYVREYAIKWIEALSGYLDAYNLKTSVVVHISYPAETPEEKDGGKSLEDFQKNLWDFRCKAGPNIEEILLENMPGTKKYNGRYRVPYMESYHPLAGVGVLYDCLERRTRIATDLGNISVSEITSRLRRGEKIKAITDNNGNLELRDILFAGKRSVKQDEGVVQVTSPLGQVRCSYDHVFYTPEGEKKAKDLVTGESVYTVENGLNSFQKDFLYGTLMGDTCLYFTRNRVRLQIQQGSVQEEYLELKRSVFSCLETGIRYQSVVKRRNGEDCITYKYITKCNESLREFKDVCYRDGKRFFSKEWMSKITPLGLAMWFYDDGSYHVRGSIRYGVFNAQSRTEEEMENVSEMLDRFKVKHSVRFNSKGAQVNLPREGVLRLQEIIEPYLYTKDLSYKHESKRISKLPEIEKVRGTSRVEVRIDKTIEKYLYDITVEGTHRYFAQHYLMHNSEHAWADDYMNPGTAKWVHLNSCPANVTRGSHIDLHSYSRIQNTLSEEFRSHILSLASDKSKKCLLERRSMEAVISDLIYLASREDKLIEQVKL